VQSIHTKNLTDSVYNGTRNSQILYSSCCGLPAANFGKSEIFSNGRPLSNIWPSQCPGHVRYGSKCKILLPYEVPFLSDWRPWKLSWQNKKIKSTQCMWPYTHSSQVLNFQFGYIRQIETRAALFSAVYSARICPAPIINLTLVQQCHKRWLQWI